MTLQSLTGDRLPSSFQSSAPPPAGHFVNSLASSPDAALNPKYRVLIVEDDIAISRLIAVNLEKAGLESRCAPDGQLGLQAFEENEPHLVLLDLMLPGKNGFEVCEAIREKSQVPIVMMTARAETAHQMRGFRVGADDYVLKPFDPQLLVARVIAHLRRVYRYDQARPDVKNGDAQTGATKTNGAPAQSPRTTPVVEPASAIPEGWARCGACDYMGPLEKFPRRTTAPGEHALSCPHCGQEKMVEFSIS